MTVLALDTTSEHGSIAIRSGGELLSELPIHAPDGFGHLLFDAIEKCKNEAKVDFGAIDLFAAASGPGSFTGVRIGLAAAKGLAESTLSGALGISNLRVLSSFGKMSSFRKAAGLDARRNEVYAALYSPDGGLLHPELVLPFNAWLAQLDGSVPHEFIMGAHSGLKAKLATSRFRHAPVTVAPACLAAAIAILAEKDAARGAILDPAAVDANYVRRSDAELKWTDRCS